MSKTEAKEKPVARKDVVYLIEDCGGWYRSGLGLATKDMTYRGLRQVQQTLIRELVYLERTIQERIPEAELVNKQIEFDGRALLLCCAQAEVDGYDLGPAIVATVVNAIEECVFEIEVEDVTDEDLRDNLNDDDEDDKDEDSEEEDEDGNDD
jgi:hypothetical protein